MGHYDDMVAQDAMNTPESIPKESSTDAILNERGSRYGSFANHSALSQALKNTIMQHYFQTHGGNEAEPLPAYMVESISMICHKLARIANGDPHYDDSWKDIAGYSQLVVEELNGKNRSGS